MRTSHRVALLIPVCGSVFAGLLCPGTLLAQQSSNSNAEFKYVELWGVTLPKPIFVTNPEYTREARKKNIEGAVTLSVIVTSTGRVTNLEITKPLDKGLDKRALTTVRTWTFRPAMRGGKPVNVRMNVEVLFKLSDVSCNWNFGIS